VPDQARGATRVVLHVGTPKSGTTFVQSALWEHRRSLRAQQVHLPGRRQRDMFLAAVEVREASRFWGQPTDRIAGTWAELCHQAVGRSGTTILSHELLGGASPAQAERALSALDGAEVHVVLTARDLVRQITSEWQERVKNGNQNTFAAFARKVRRHVRRETFAGGFWRNQDVVGVLDRWAGAVPPDRVHVVVAPPAGAEPQVLWERFAAACGFDATGLDPLAAGARNPALGTAQAAALRQVNIALGGRIGQPDYERVVKHAFAETVLAAQEGERPRCPARLAAVLDEVAAGRNEVLRARGYRVHGGLDDLIGAPDQVGGSPDRVADQAVISALARAVADLLERP